VFIPTNVSFYYFSSCTTCTNHSTSLATSSDATKRFSLCRVIVAFALPPTFPLPPINHTTRKRNDGKIFRFPIGLKVRPRFFFKSSILTTCTGPRHAARRALPLPFLLVGFDANKGGVQHPTSSQRHLPPSVTIENEHGCSFSRVVCCLPTPPLTATAENEPLSLLLMAHRFSARAAFMTLEHECAYLYLIN